MKLKPDFLVIISANAEWQAVRNGFPNSIIHQSPYGEWFTHRYEDFTIAGRSIIFFHGGWGKVASAGSTQYVISRWKPRLLVNIGTCGGFEGKITKGQIILVDKTVIYDIYEQMGDPDEHIKHYSTEIDTSWLIEPLPIAVIRTILVSADRDLFCDEIPALNSKYGAIAGDWESGAIAWVAARNKTQCLILRGVTDLVSEKSGEAYDGKVNFYYESTRQIMKQLLDSLPHWLEMYKLAMSSKQ
jgi:adenosylhomocysteine nucleosidase